MRCPVFVPSNTYPTRDGKFQMHQRQQRCDIQTHDNRAIGRAFSADDATLTTNAAHVPRTAELDGAIAD